MSEVSKLMNGKEDPKGGKGWKAIGKPEVIPMETEGGYEYNGSQWLQWILGHTMSLSMAGPMIDPRVADAAELLFRRERKRERVRESTTPDDARERGKRE